MEVARFFATPTGRGLRIIVGLALVAWAIYTPALWWLGLIGAIVAVAGAANVCGLAPLVGGPFNGRQLPPRVSKQA